MGVEGSNSLKLNRLINNDYDNSSDHGFVLTREQDNRDWTICSSHATENQQLVKMLTVACRQFGYTSLSTLDKVARKEISPYLMEVSPCLPTLWKCSGDENALSECASEEADNLSLVLYLECSYSETPQEGDVRFVGNHPYRGYVELFHNSVWGKLCPVENMTNLQTAVCKQLHLGPFVETYERVNQQMFGQIHDLVVSCKGKETNLAQCQKQEIPVVCSSVYTLYATCLTPIEKLSIRLHPISTNQTAAQVYLMNTWSFIGWDNHWSIFESAVVCGMLQQGPPEYFYSQQLFLKGPHFNFYPSCQGSEKTLLDCKLKIDYVGRGALTDAVVVKCAPLYSTKDNDVMLVENSDFARSNYVFISETLQWHAVCGCSDVWSSASAAVICRAMGFKGGYDSAVAAGGIMSRFGHPVQLTCPSQDVQTLSECNINQCNTSMCSLAATVHCSDSVLMKCGGPAFAIPYSLFYIVFGIPAIIAVLFVYRKLREARRITNQIVTANAAETADLWEITLDPMESSLPPPSYNAFIENPELYPVLAGVTDSIPDDDLPPYPGLPESTTKV
ncbi:putative neurotrypsin-like [Apostichopus japonicus]|uniref:Putative neurotrypsin-like n=1 Tax=Stichopus japonicus TaxID=307972 RepID=A0A2G8LNP4_STIJA|nr:putative neurotrypsin-like [Apostichopus japonicus]